MKIYEKYNEKKFKIVCCGDWNRLPNILQKSFIINNLPCFIESTPRKLANRKRSKRVIDYGVSNFNDLIINQIVRKS